MNSHASVAQVVCATISFSIVISMTLVGHGLAQSATPLVQVGSTATPTLSSLGATKQAQDRTVEAGWATVAAQPTPLTPEPIVYPTSPAPTTPTTGISTACEAAEYTHVIRPANCWTDIVNNQYLFIAAGVAPDDLQQGKLGFGTSSLDGGTSSRWFDYPAPLKTGSLRITDVQLPRITLIAENGTTLVFNIDTRSWENTPAGIARPVIARINAGGPAVTINGANWSADQYFSASGSRAYTNPNVSSIPNSEQDAFFLSHRSTDATATPLNYAIPVPAKGFYIVRLYFAEIYFGSPSASPSDVCSGSGCIGKRLFSINLEGGTLELANYDIAKEIGIQTAIVKQFGIAVTDGTLNIAFTATTNRPLISAIEVLQDPNVVVRLNAGGLAVTPRDVSWSADQYSSGGSAYKNAFVPYVANTGDDAIYVSHRSTTGTAKTFNYNIPVPANGSYRVRLHFAEIFWGATNGGIWSE